MEHRRLGRSGLSVSALAYGNAITHGAQVDDDTAVSCVQAALACGITTFDTADAYAGGRAEEVLGRALRNERREGLEICTKVFWPTGPNPNDRGLSRKHIIKSCEASLRRLGLDYIDVYFAHRSDPTVPLEETMVALSDLVRTGKVLYVGVSEWMADDIVMAAELARALRISLIASQPQYSLLWRVIEESVIPACAREGIGQIVWSPLAQGVLTGKYRAGQQLPRDTRAGDAHVGDPLSRELMDRFTQPSVLSAVERLEPLARETGLSLAQLALAWVLQNPHVSAAVIGASRPEQIIHNVKAVSVQLDPDLITRLDIELDPIAGELARAGAAAA
jgi:aryl-alcohol dehydrogenase-like predicted oxidoreductase